MRRTAEQVMLAAQQEREAAVNHGAGRVTIAGLADQLGLSKASVSYALNGLPGVSDETRLRVLALARKNGNGRGSA